MFHRIYGTGLSLEPSSRLQIHSLDLASSSQTTDEAMPNTSEISALAAPYIEKPTSSSSLT